MSVSFRDCRCGPLQGITVAAPSGAIIGIIGEDGAGKQELLRLAAGTLYPDSGSVDASEPRRYHGPLDPFHCELAATLGLYHTFALKDAVTQAGAIMELERFRRKGGTALIASHDLDFLASVADEIWWLDSGALKAKGDPAETIEAYRRHSAHRLQAEAAARQIQLPPSMRRGDGRAELLSIETLDPNGSLTAAWQSGADARVRVTVRFHQPVADPVIGILIRTRIGFEVYGTNTELERVELGPCRQGETLAVDFRFVCHICPGEYTVTAASHDPDGVWHDWVEDGVAVRVADHRYTAGVACLRSSVEVSRYNQELKVKNEG
jgi:lipopolysaccharide transport system ATP-binding protein